jgi:hypothetical protein
MRHEIVRLSVTKRWIIWRDKKPETRSKNKNIRNCIYRGINKFKKGYQPRTNFVKGDNSDPPAGSHNI